MSRYAWICVTLWLLACAAAQAQSFPPSCTATTGAVTPTLRSEGMTELAGDIVILCTGGTAVPAGSTLPQGQITVFLNTAVTSRLEDTSNGSEALLLIDEPGSALNGAPATQLACATVTGCSIVSNGAEPYDGSPGHPNVFQGVVSGNTVTFSGVPISGPGEYGINSNGTFTRVLRITNLRVNANAVMIGSPVNASIAVTGLFLFANPGLNIAFAESGLSYQTRNAANTAPVATVDASACSAGSYCPVAILQFQENFATAFKTRVQGTAQNIPGQIYNTESGFYNPGLGSSNPELATAGYANAATRLKADFYNLPFGAQVWVGLNSIGSAGAALTANEAGPFAPVAGLQLLTNSSSGITSVPAAPLTITNLAAEAVWEINSVNPAAIDTAQFPVWVYFPPGTAPSGNLTILAGSLAPNPSDPQIFNGSSGTIAQNSTYPIPRFASAPAPAISSLVPASSEAGGPSFLLTVDGSGFLAGATVDWQGTPLTTNFLTSNQLTATVPSTDIAVGGTVAVTVVNPGNPESLPQTYTVTGPVSVTPATGSGSTQIFSFVYDDALGASDMSSVLIDFGSSTTNSCLVQVAPQTGVVSLLSDAAEVTSQSTIGAPGTLENSQCTLNTGLSSATTSANTYTLNLALTFQSSYSGVQTITSSLTGQSGTATGGINLGSWTVPAAGQQQLGAVSVTPSSGTGLNQTFVVVFTDNLGASDLASVQTLFNTSISNSLGCSVSINPQTAAVNLASNASAQGTLGTAGTLQNNQCTLNVGASSAVSSGNTYTLTLSLTFQNLTGAAASGFAGMQNVYGFACSNENLCSGWQSLGSWTVPQPQSVIQASVNPSSGSGAGETFTFSFTDSLGASDMDALNIIFNSSSGTVNSCVVSINPQNGLIALFADSSSNPPTQSTLGAAGSLQNSQCAVNVGASSGAFSGNTYTLVLAMSFSNSDAGTKNIYATGVSTSGGYVSLQTVGTWTIPVTSIFSPNAVPATPFLGGSLTVGVKFESSVSGTIAGIRFYKGAGNTGTHIGLLYSYPSGTLLAQAAFTNETASGWQQVNFSTPVTIAANTVYVAAYFSSTGFAYNSAYFSSSGVTNAPLEALQTGVAGPNGVYVYGSAAAYPSNDGGGANYWADVVFNAMGTVTGTPDLTITSSHTGNFTQGQSGATYTVIAINSGTAATSGTVTVTEALPTGLTAVSMLGNNWTCTQPAGPCTRSDSLAPGLSYDPITVTVNVSATAPATATNTATVSGGGETNTANDQATDPTTIASASVTTGTATSIWPSSVVPASPWLSASLTVGVKFRSDVSGSITGIRFYKGAGNNGTHIGLLYSSSGTLLAQATFTGETASGWQQVSFATPVAITANTVYVAAYFSTTGFAYNAGYFTGTGVDNTPLHALAYGVSGPDGVYAYGTAAQFPSSDGAGANYWADVVFSSTETVTGTPDLTITSSHTGNFTQGQDSATYTVTTTNSGTASTSGTVTVAETLPTGLTAVSMLGAGWTCTQPAGSCTRSDALAAGSSYATITVTVNVSATAPASVTNTATVSGGGEIDMANNQTTDLTTIVSTSGGTATSIWPVSAVPANPWLSASLTVGVKFRSDVGGNITGIRFYKGAGNNGTHIGLLYNSGGTLLAQATFTGETTSGWQQVNFSTPVAIAANTVYVAAYFSTTGFAYNAGYFTSTGVDNAPLHALAYGVSGPDGVYAYGSAAQFPSNDGGGANYWADVVFSSTGTVTGGPDLTITSSHTDNFTQGQTGATYTVTATNSGTASTSGTVTVTETLPTGLTAVSMLDNNNNWTCTQPAGPCMRSDALAAGLSYDPITVTVNVSATAPASVTNTVPVSGGGENNTANDQATDPTTIASASVTTGTATSIWPSSVVPASPWLSASLTVGVKFRSDVSGNITGIRFYKGTGNNGTHMGLLYTSSGTLLAQATFTGETASGWQQVNFATPVAITANTVYVAAYFSATGFAYNAGYFTSTGVDNAPLHALAYGVSGPDGVYAYGSAAQFPSSDGAGANYWADVVFSSTGTVAGTPDLTTTSSHTGNFTQGQNGATYTVTATNSGAASTSGTVTVTETLPTGLTAVSMLGNNWTCTQPAGPCTRSDPLAAGLSYDPITVTVNVSATAPASVTNTATVSGGGETDTANDQATDSTTIASASSGAVTSIWSASAVPANPLISGSLTVGVKFRSDVSGNITGIRFYKGTGNNGTHIGLLYSSSGALLAQATFTGETASGWQQVNFSTPVAITANTVYIAAYFSTTGFAYTAGYFTSTGTDNAPLHALEYGVSGPNGVYAYGTAAQFPSNDGSGANYWADVVFSQ